MLVLLVRYTREIGDYDFVYYRGVVLLHRPLEATTGSVFLAHIPHRAAALHAPLRTYRAPSALE